jgi:hypothetical protein
MGDKKFTGKHYISSINRSQRDSAIWSKGCSGFYMIKKSNSSPFLISAVRTGWLPPKVRDTVCGV